MLWEITCYNGAIWQPKTQCTLTDALVMFCKETWRNEWEQAENWEELKLELNFESNMRDMDEWYEGSFDPDHARALELSDDDCNDCGMCPTCNGELGSDCSARNLDNDKTLADILREAVQR